MAANATITGLTTTLSAQVGAGQALPADILALSAGLVSEGITFRDTVQARRVGIIAADLVVASYDGTESLSKTAARFQECISSDGFVRSAIASDSDLGQVRYGLAMSTARMNGIATATLARATTFQALYGAALPA